MKSLSRVRLFEIPMDCSLPDSSVHGIFQAIVLEWIAISFSSGSFQPRDQTQVFHIVDRRFTICGPPNFPLLANYMCVCVCVCIMIIISE